MSKIPSFGFKSKLKAPAVLKARTANGASMDHGDFKTNVNSAQEGPSSSNGYDAASYSSNINEDEDPLQKNNDVVVRRAASKENLEQTSNSLSKLADKLNAGKNIPGSGAPSKGQLRPAFRRKGSSNIAKLNSGKSKERSGATQIHGQTPYTKTPRIDSKPPVGGAKTGTEAPSNFRSKLSRPSGIPDGRAVLRKEDDKEADNGNDTFSMPSKMQKGESNQICQEDEEQVSSLSTSTTTAVPKPTVGGATTSGLRPPSGCFAGIATGVPGPRADNKMRPPANPIAGQTLKSRVGGNIPKTIDGKGLLARKNSGQEIAIVKRNSKENLGSIVTPRQKAPSKELQTMAEKLKLYSGKRTQRPASIASEADLSRSAVKPKDRRSVHPTNLRTVNSSSLQDMRGKHSSQEASVSKIQHRRSISYDRSTKERRSLLPSKAEGNKTGKGLGTQDQGVPSKQGTVQSKLRPRSNSKRFNSTTSEFGIHETVSGEPYQSTPVSKTAVDAIAPGGNGHPFDNALNATLSGVFEDGCAPSDENVTRVNCQRLLNETFDGNGHNRTFDTAPVKNATFTPEACSSQPPMESDIQPSLDYVVCNKETFCKNPRFDATFEVGSKDKVISESSMRTDESFSLTVDSKELASETQKLSTLEDIESKDVPGNKLDILKDESSSLLMTIDSCKAITNQNLAGGNLEALIDGYQSDDMILNETMPTLDGSFTLNVSNDVTGVVSSSPAIASEQPLIQNVDRCSIEASVEISVKRPKSASRELKFDGLPRDEGKIGLTDGVLATSVINDSYDVVTIEEACSSAELSESAKTATGDVLDTRDSSVKTDVRDFSSNSEKSRTPGDNDASQVETESKPTKVPQETEMKTSTDGPPLSDEPSPVNPEKTVRVGTVDLPTSVDTPNRFQIQLPSDRTEPEIGHTKPAIGGDFSSLLSQTVEDLGICTEKKTQANTENMIVNLLTPEDSSDAVREILDSLSTNANQMKIAARKRSLVRRNTSPYMTSSSMPTSTSSCTSFRIPRETSIAETGDGNVIIDEGTYRHWQNDMRMFKTNLLRLKRVLQEVDTVSPFVKHPNQFANAPPVTPARANMLSRSFSDASSWLTKVKKIDVPSGGEQMNQTPKSSLNRTDEDKVKDELKELREHHLRLERELEEARHEIESKNNTIRLLQTQLEHQEYMEQMELLLEEKIMLFEENQELKERIEELENAGPSRSSSFKSIKEEYMKQTKNASKIKSEIVKGYYEEN